MSEELAEPVVIEEAWVYPNAVATWDADPQPDRPGVYITVHSRDKSSSIQERQRVRVTIEPIAEPKWIPQPGDLFRLEQHPEFGACRMAREDEDHPEMTFVHESGTIDKFFGSLEDSRLTFIPMKAVDA